MRATNQQSFIPSLCFVPFCLFSLPFAHAQLNPKKGLSIKSAHSCDAFNKHTSSSWWYSWGSNDTGFDDSFCPQSSNPVSSLRSGSNNNNNGRDFVPMFWGKGMVPTGAVEQLYLTNPKLHDNLFNAKYLMTFNEPNLSSQSNVLEADAANLWPQIRAIATHYNLGLVAPCVTQGAEGEGWLDNFIHECSLRYATGCEFEFVCVHMYYEPTPCDAGVRGAVCVGDNVLDTSNKATRRLDQIANKYGKQIWLTEFGCSQWSGDPTKCDESDHAGIIAQITPYLDKSANIFRYAFFTVYANSLDYDISLNKILWDRMWGRCASWLWIRGRGSTWAQCVENARTNYASQCYQDRLTISRNGDGSCYCGTDACDNMIAMWQGMWTFQEIVNPRPGTDELTEIGILYNTDYTLWGAFKDWWNSKFDWLSW